MIIAAKTVITGDGKTVLTDSAVLAGADGRIAGVGSLAQLKAQYPAEEVLDYGDATLLPGLIDMHVHLGYWWSKPDGHNYNEHLIAYLTMHNAQQALFSGVTTVRDVSSPHMVCQKLREAADKGYVRAPRILCTDRGICYTGGHGWVLAGGSIEADGEAEVRKAVRTVLRDGADWVKIMSSHRASYSEYTQAELDAAADECHRMGKRLAVHAGTQPSIQMAIDAGIDTIEHGTDLTVEQCLQMKEKGLTWVPTIIAYTYIFERVEAMLAAADGGNGTAVDEGLTREHFYFRNAAKTYRDNFKKLYDTGVRITTGTDMVMDGAEAAPVARELQYFVDYGITPVQAVATATANCAAALDLEGEIGILAPGAVADLLVVEGDASADIRALQRVREVFQNGKAVRREI